MKKIIFLFVTFLAIVSCKKDADQDGLDFGFVVNAVEENFSAKDIEEPVTFEFNIDTHYDFEKVPMKYKVNSNEKTCEVTNGTQRIALNDVYELKEPKLVLTYIGKSAKKQNIEVTFYNNKGVSITKEIPLEVIEKKQIEEFTVSFKSKSEKIMEKKPFEFSLEFDIPNRGHYASTEYFVTFKEIEVKYEGKYYQPGEKIPVVITNKANSFEAKMIGKISEGIYFSNRYTDVYESLYYVETMDKIFSGKVFNSDNIVQKIELKKRPDFYIPIQFNGAYIKYFFWSYDKTCSGVPLPSDGCIGGYDYDYKEAFRFSLYEDTSRGADDDDYLFKDNQINKNAIKIDFFLEKKGGGLDLIKTVSDITNLYQGGNATLIHEKYMGENVSNPYNDNMRIIVYYNNKEVYEVKGIKNVVCDGCSDTNNIEYVKFPKGKVIFEHYDNPAGSVEW
jgi:lipoprotein